MNEQLGQLREIEGLDHISWWPLAVGWWAVIALIVLLIVAFIVRKVRKERYSKNWYKDTYKQLSSLQQNLSKDNSQETATILSEIIRRIAIYKYSRNECAGIYGKEWLIWLKSHDPKNFDWETEGQLLIDAPYAPPNASFTPDKIEKLITAIKEWIK
jgi:hypothetical protein